MVGFTLPELTGIVANSYVRQHWSRTARRLERLVGSFERQFRQTSRLPALPGFTRAVRCLTALLKTGSAQRANLSELDNRRFDTLMVAWINLGIMTEVLRKRREREAHRPTIQI